MRHWFLRFSTSRITGTFWVGETCRQGLGVLWSLAVEEHYYLLFLLLYWWFVRKQMDRRYQATVLIALCLGERAGRCYRVLIWHSSWKDIYEGTDTRFDSILAGCVLAIVANSRLGDRVPWLTKHAATLAWSGAMLIGACFVYRNAIFRDTVRYTLLELGLMPIFFFVTLPRASFITRCMEWRGLRHLGQLSYSMYLIHHTLFHHFYHYYRPSVLLTIAYAQAMRICVELPIQRLRGRWMRRVTCVVIPPANERQGKALASQGYRTPAAFAPTAVDDFFGFCRARIHRKSRHNTRDTPTHPAARPLVT